MIFPSTRRGVPLSCIPVVSSMRLLDFSPSEIRICIIGSALEVRYGLRGGRTIRGIETDGRAGSTLVLLLLHSPSMAPELRNRRIAGFDYGGELELEDLQPRVPPSPPKWRRAVENTLWLGAAAFALYYGDGHSNFFAVLYSNPKIIRRPFYVGLLCVAINTLIFLYLAVWIRHVVKTDVNWDIIAPGAIPTATILGVSSFLMFVFAFWPVWGFLTLPLLVTLFMSFVIISPYLPPYARKSADESDPLNLYKNHD